MAVQKSRVTRSKRGMRRAHDGLTKPTLAVDIKTGATHRRHHITLEGYYKGRQIINKKPAVIEEADEE